MQNNSDIKKGRFTKSMKKALFFACIVLCTLFTVTSVFAGTLSPGLDVIAHSTEMTVSGLCDETVTFTGEQFAAAAGVGEYESIRITSLPAAEDGTLMYNDAAVCNGQVIAYDKIANLSFSPSKGAADASFEFTFDGSYTMTCAIKLENTINSAPTAGPCPVQYTITSAPCRGTMRAADPDGDALSYEIVKYPESGRLVFDSTSGEFTYTPGKTVGSVSFEYRVKDAKGAMSDSAEVFVNISANTASVTFEDMDGSDYVAAAVTMADKGVMSYSEKDDKLYFEPEEKVSRLEFLISAMNSFGADKLPEISATGFDDDGDIPEEYKSYVYSANKLGIVSGINKDGKCFFEPNNPITLAEASVILNNVIGYEASSPVICEDAVPTWAKSSVDAIYELGITDAEGGHLGASDELTRASAAQMLYKLCALIYE